MFDLPFRNDKKDLKQLKETLELMSEEELERFYTGMFNILTVADVIFERRFKDSWDKIQQRIEDGTF